MKRVVLALLVVCGGAVVLSGCVVAGGYSNSGSGTGFVLLLPLLVFAWFMFSILRIGRRARRGTSEAGRSRSMHDGAGAASAPMLRAELSVLADDVLRLDPQVSMKPEARDDFDAAVHRYRVAQAAIDRVETPVDLMRVQRVVDEATYAMSRARATLEGRPPPPPPEPLQRPGRTGEPAVQLDDRDRPYYVNSPATFHAGWFGLGGGLLGGLFLGPLLRGFEFDDGGDDGEDDGSDFR